MYGEIKAQRAAGRESARGLKYDLNFVMAARSAHSLVAEYQSRFW
jgi:hypothetical protein